VAEELYQHLMICHQKLGRPTDALSVYNRGQKTLRAVLGVEPSERTQEIYKTLATNRRTGESEKGGI
jgi:DNA-binding SARP family transcriptional activator